MPQPKAVADLIDQGLAAQQSGDVSGAREKYEGGRELSPDDPEALHLLGLVHEQESDRRGAIRLIERAIAADPSSAETLVADGRQCTAGQRFDQAGEVIDKALAINPESLTGLFALSWLKYFIGDLLSAEVFGGNHKTSGVQA